MAPAPLLTHPTSAFPLPAAPQTVETEEAMKITIGPTCRHTSLPARSRGQQGRGA